MSIRNLLAAASLATFSSVALSENTPILAHQLFGNGEEKVIVFHDWMGDAGNYDSIKPWLNTQSYTFAFAEVRGYGGSKALVGKYNSDEIAHDTFALAKHLGWENFHLVAHSMNGMAGFKTLLIDSQMEHKIKSYVAVTPVTPDGYPASEEEAAFLSSAVNDRQVSDNAFSALTGGKLNSAWANYKTSRNKLTSRADAMNEYLNMWLNEDFSQEFANAKIKTPVMVIGGRNDLPGFQEEHFQKTLVKWLPNVSFNYIENAGHYPMYETPILFATLIEKHLDANR